MTTLKQVEANRRNARHSTGPVTERGKQRSRCNAVRHGLTAETVIGALEDADDYKAFEAAVIADYDAQTAVERELVLRLASLLWRIRRATSMETGLFEIEARHLLETREAPRDLDRMIQHLSGLTDPDRTSAADRTNTMQTSATFGESADDPSDLTHCFLRLANLPTFPLDRLSRYEVSLWRQAGQTIFALNALAHPPQRRSRYPRSTRRWVAEIGNDD